MPTTGLLALLDDIATMSKVAAQKTIGISGDDLAVNSQAILGADPKREWPIVWEVAKGSLRNKAILIPAALGLSVFAPWAIVPALTLGGLYLCVEGIEKVIHKKHGDEHAFVGPRESAENAEKRKISGAVKTDMILSAEIVVVALGTVAAAPLLTQALVLGAIGIGMTAGIYGLVGGILKLDDLGVLMTKVKGDNFVSKSVRAMGRGLVASVPAIMKTIAVVGTAAMFMVGGGLLAHGIPGAEHGLKALAHMVSQNPALVDMAEMAIATVAGMAAGLAAIPVIKVLEGPMKAVTGACSKAVSGVKKLFKKKTPKVQKAPAIAVAPTLPEPTASTLRELAPLKDAMNKAVTPDATPGPAPEFKPAPKPQGPSL